MIEVFRINVTEFDSIGLNRIKMNKRLKGFN